MTTLARSALLAVAASAVACGKQTFMAAVLLGTPAVPNPIAPSQSLPAQTYSLAYLGTIDTSNPTKLDASKIGTITGAAADIAFHTPSGNVDLPLKDQGAGAYSIDSNSTSGFVYDFTGKEQYTLVLTDPATKESYGAKFLPLPQITIKEFATSKLVSQKAGGDFTMTRTDAPVDGQLLPAFVLVMDLGTQQDIINGKTPTVDPSKAVFTNVPQDATSMLKLALSDQDYRKPSFTVPAAKLQSGHYYVASLIVIRYGLVSENTFTGSTALSGTGDAGVLAIQ